MSEGGYVYAMGSNTDCKLGIGNSEIRSVNVPTLVEGICNI
jgi:alpha-tubulin suppressor-like RCC1 family protein